MIGEIWKSGEQKTQRREWSTKSDTLEQSCKIGMEENVALFGN